MSPSTAAEPALGPPAPEQPRTAAPLVTSDVAAEPDALPVLGSLSPSRAGDFLQCPLLFRFRAIDRLPQAPSAAATRGTVVHGVLERLFDLPAAARTLEAAAGMVEAEWERVCAEEPAVSALFPGGEGLMAWLDSARALLEGYFSLEDPQRLEPAQREQAVEVVLQGGLRLRGIVDRLDVAAGSGAVRVVDYKTGRSPAEMFEGKALFQMKFYALVLWRTRGQMPALLQLMYLGDREVLRYVPDEAALLATERKLLAVWEAVERAVQRGEFTARRSRLCDWCDHQALCPEFGGTPPPLPADAASRLAGSSRVPLQAPPPVATGAREDGPHVEAGDRAPAVVHTAAEPT